MRRLFALAVVVFVFAPLAVFGGDAASKTVEALNLDKDKLSGQVIQIKGKVVKVNNGIMNRNFLHIQDGTGAEGSNDITITSEQSAEVGDEVTVTGTVVLNKDFGYGYAYPILLEQSAIQIAKKK